MANLRPLNDRVIVKTVAPEEKTLGGIILPDSAQEKPTEAEVVAVGPGKTLDNGKTVPVDVKVGDRVIYAKYGGTEVKVGGDDFIILRQDDILAVKE
ncbi:10 kDa chaperonin [Armatimonadota bacterium]|nr:co-chaperone GroES [Armatimonadota bacterium]GDX40025.1 10 kDa chaperonin [Armatimonadota bacterium]